jgi:hypothetical protein
VEAAEPLGGCRDEPLHVLGVGHVGWREQRFCAGLFDQADGLMPAFVDVDVDVAGDDGGTVLGEQLRGRASDALAPPVMRTTLSV